ncbi:MAG: MFS transporter [Bacillota bacterium]|nr:MFS transporter [Bacillota bacterium]
MRKITDRKYILILFWTCWFVYFSTYIGRQNFAAVIAEMESQGFIDKTYAGLVTTCQFLAYGFGQFLSGFLSDRYNPKWIMITGLFISSVINLLMGFLKSAFPMPYLWAINGLALSLTWCPIVRMLTDYLKGKELLRANVNMATCSVTGTFVVYVMCCAVIRTFDFRTVFFIASATLLSAILIWIFGLKAVISHAEECGAEEIINSDKPLRSSTGKFLAIAQGTGFMFIILASAMHCALKDGVTTWIPSYFKDNFNMGIDKATLLTAVLPIVNLPGVYFGEYINRKIFKNEMASSTALFIISSIAAVLLYFTGSVNAIISTVLLCIFSMSMYGVNIITISLVPLKFVKYGKAATATGILNASAYIGGAFASYIFGFAAQNKGWNFTLLTWVMMALAGCLFSAVTIIKWKRFIKG